MEKETTYNGNVKSIISNDENGEFQFKVVGFTQRPIQIVIETEDVGDAYINVNLKELTAIRDLLNEAINTFQSATETNP